MDLLKSGIRKATQLHENTEKSEIYCFSCLKLSARVTALLFGLLVSEQTQCSTGWVMPHFQAPNGEVLMGKCLCAWREEWVQEVNRKSTAGIFRSYKAACTHVCAMLLQLMNNERSRDRSVEKDRAAVCVLCGCRQASERIILFISSAARMPWFCVSVCVLRNMFASALNPFLCFFSCWPL